MEKNEESGSLFFELNNVSDAVISSDGMYRYFLSRKWDNAGLTVGFICLNPSTADAFVDDQTVKKCVRFAKKWGAGQLIIGNLFALRSTDPAALRKSIDPVGPDNDKWINTIAEKSNILVAAWGNHGVLGGRNVIVRAKHNSKLTALKLSKNGHPCHPLYLPESLVPIKW